MTYSVNFSDPGKDPIVLESMEKDITSTSITLHGRGAKNYGEDQQENFLHLLENFASPLEPLHPVEGQLWYDTSTTPKTLRICVSNVAGNASWVSIQSTSTTTTIPTNPVAGQLWYDIANQIQYVYNGTTWEAIQSTSTSTTTPINPVAGQLWYDIANQIQYVYTGTSWQPITNNIVDPSLQYLAIVFS